MKKSQADEDEDYMLLMSLLPSIKRTGRHSKIGTQNGISEHRNQENSNFEEFFSQPFISVPNASDSSCLPSPSPLAAKSRFNTFARFIHFNIHTADV